MKKVDFLELKSVLIGLSVIFVYMFMNQFELLPLTLMGINYANLSITSKVIYLFTFEILIALAIFLLLKPKIITDFKDMKKHLKEYAHTYFKYWLIAFGIMVLSNLFITMIMPNTIAGNEQAVRSNFSKAPIYTFLSAVVIAPFIEECVFRLGFRKIFKTKWLFIVLSGFVFGSLHVFGSLTSWFDLLYLIPYCAPGFVFAYVLTKSDNIFVPIGLHFIHNGFLMVLQTILLFL